MTGLTDAQKSALLWLRNRGGDGVFDKNNVLIARGERAPVMYSTWKALVQEKYAVRYGAKNRRYALSDQGLELNLTGVTESEAQPEEDDDG